MRHLLVRHLIASLTVVGAVLASAAFAQETTDTPVKSEQPAAPAPTAVEVPKRGSTMDVVRAKFGAPSQEVPAVGVPPISRWEYPSYVVFFEKDRVLHTVVK